MDSGIKLDKLNEQNYHTWAFKTLSYLTSKGLEQIVLADPQNNDEWRNRDKQTRAIISLTISNDLIPIIQCKDDVKYNNINNYNNGGSSNDYVGYKYKDLFINVVLIFNNKHVETKIPTWWRIRA